MANPTGIASISRDWGENPAIVRVTTYDSLASVQSPGYFTSQAANIEALQNGDFQWQQGDAVLVYYYYGTGGSTASTFPSTVLYDYNVSLDQLYSLSPDLSLYQPITAAAFNGMYAAPILVSIAAPGAGFIIDVRRWGLTQVFGTSAYASGGPVQLQYGSTVHGAGPEACGTIPAANITGITTGTQEVATSGLMGNGVNANVQLYLSNTTGAFTTGDGTWTLWVDYIIRDIL